MEPKGLQVLPWKDKIKWALGLTWARVTKSLCTSEQRLQSQQVMVSSKLSQEEGSSVAK